HLGERARDHSDHLTITRIGNRLHICSKADYCHPRSRTIDSSPLDPFADWVLARPESSRERFGYDTHLVRFRSVALQKLTSLENGVRHGLEVSRHGDAKIGKIKSARLRWRIPFNIKRHEIPRSLHR